MQCCWRFKENLQEQDFAIGTVILLPWFSLTRTEWSRFWCQTNDLVGGTILYWQNHLYPILIGERLSWYFFFCILYYKKSAVHSNTCCNIGIRIGPEPTTDRFIAVMHGDTEGVIPGNALVVDPKKQFRPLSKFGNAFLNRFQCSTVDSPVLKGISIVDSPGILSGEKQRTDRGYEFTGVLEWFAERVDRIILLFDAHKLDISDEFRRSIEALRGHDDKIRIILNKVSHFQFIAVWLSLADLLC